MNSIYLIGRALMSNFLRLRKPYKLTLAVTNKCNSRCLRCGIWKSGIENEWFLTDYEKLFKENGYFSWIDITGGEVFLRKDLLEIVKLIKKYERKLYLLHIPTNGIETTSIVKTVSEIIKIGFSKFIMTVSLDGLPVTHNRLRGVDNNWVKAVETYKQLKKMRDKNFDCFLGMTISGENVTDIKELIALLKKEILDFKESDLHFNIAHISDNYYKNCDFEFGDRKKVARELKKYFDEKKYYLNPLSFLEMVYQKGVSFFLIKNKSNVKCRSAEVSVFINNKGEVYPCSMWNKKMGSLKDNNYSIIKILNKNKLLISEIRAGKCGSCWTPCEAYQSILGNLGASIFGILGQYARKTSRKNPNG